MSPTNQLDLLGSFFDGSIALTRVSELGQQFYILVLRQAILHPRFAS
jgi:hypothetical protein